MSNKDRIEEPLAFKLLRKVDFLFVWLHLFYPKAKEVNPVVKLFNFVPQKILRINGRVPWPVHFTSLVLHHQNIAIGRNSPIGSNIGCYIQGKAGVIVGDNCRMGPNVGLISANHDPNDYDFWIKTAPIVIGNNVWIGMNSVVMPGVKIGDNVVIGSNSTVTKNIPSNCIAIGSPCKPVKEKGPYFGKVY